MRPIVEEVRAFPLITGRPGFTGRLMRDARLLLGVQPAVDAMAAEAVRMHAAKPFDVALISGKQTMPVLRALPDVPFVADICDAASMRVRGRMPHVGWWRRPRLQFAALVLQRIERQFATAAFRAHFASPRDRDAVLGANDPKGIVVPNGVDLGYWQKNGTGRSGQRIVFTGNLSYAPNADAAMQLARDIFPQVREAVPDAELFLVGRDPLPELIEFAKTNPKITVTGLVDDIRPYLESATVFAAPLRFGAGIQNKVLEALAMDVPVVASPVAADGLQTADGTAPPLSVAKNNDQFVRAIVRQLWSTDQSSTGGRAFIERYFSWHESGELLEQSLVAAASTHSVREGVA
jgi:glycosyltransferase involved in cell wall biosynthesis